MFTPMLNFATGGVLLALSATICGFCASFLVIYLLRFADGLKRVGVDEQRH
jgi:hypothetical protein